MIFSSAIYGNEPKEVNLSLEMEFSPLFFVNENFIVLHVSRSGVFLSFLLRFFIYLSLELVKNSSCLAEICLFIFVQILSQQGPWFMFLFHSIHIFLHSLAYVHVHVQYYLSCFYNK